jgi:TPP-dependent pyruvate/acetoin dehydrogenase alpha subunit
VLDSDEVGAIRAEVDREVAAAIEFARSSPLVDSSRIAELVFAS